MTVTISRDGNELGNWLEHEVRAFYSEGRLIDSDHYWMEGMTQWLPLVEFIRPPPPFPAATSPLSVVPIAPPPEQEKVRNKTEPSGELELLEAIGGLDRKGFAIASFAVIALSAIISASTYQSGDFDIIQVITAAVLVGLTAARLKNIGMPRGFCFLIIVPIVGLIFFISCLALPTSYAARKRRLNNKWLVMGGIITSVGTIVFLMGLSVYLALHSSVHATTSQTAPTTSTGYP